MKTKIHATAGVIGFLTIAVFWASTAYSELFGTSDTIVLVKSMVLKGMFILIPAMIVVGASGMNMGHRRKDAPAISKKKRMPFIAANGLIILLPAAFYLEGKASAGSFDASFYTVQVLELIAGATNFLLIGFNIRDGRKMTEHKRSLIA